MDRCLPHGLQRDEASAVDEEVPETAHQTIGIDMTSGLKGLTLCVKIRLRLPTKDVEGDKGTGQCPVQIINSV